MRDIFVNFPRMKTGLLLCILSYFTLSARAQNDESKWDWSYFDERIAHFYETKDLDILYWASWNLYSNHFNHGISNQEDLRAFRKQMSIRYTQLIDLLYQEDFDPHDTRYSSRCLRISSDFMFPIDSNEVRTRKVIQANNEYYCRESLKHRLYHDILKRFRLFYLSYYRKKRDHFRDFLIDISDSKWEWDGRTIRALKKQKCVIFEK